MLVVDHFEVADGGLAAGTPVDDVRSAIDEPLLEKADESLPDCDGEVLVHGEILALPIDGGAQALHLIQNCAAIVALPLPDSLDEGFPAKLLAACAL